MTTAGTGAPFTPGVSISTAGSSNITGNTVANATSEGGRLAMVPGCNPYTGCSDPWNRLNSACFTAPQPGSLGLESGINSLYAPGFINFDMSLQKQFTVRERLNFQFRVDAFNVFNHANFTTLNTTLNFSGTYPGGLMVANNAYTNGVLTNKTGFGTVNTQLSSNTAALPGSPRILQLVVRVQF